MLQKQNKTKQIDNMNIVASIILITLCFFLSQSWDQLSAIELQNQLLRKYFSDEEIKSGSLRIIHTSKSTTVSNGYQLPQFEHDKYNTDFFKRSIPTKIFLLCSIICIVVIAPRIPCLRRWFLSLSTRCPCPDTLKDTENTETGTKNESN
jgi:hypothetical protein